MLTSSSCLNGCIKSQQIGLLRNICNSLSQLCNIVCHLGSLNSFLQGSLGFAIYLLSLSFRSLHIFLQNISTAKYSLTIFSTLRGFVSLSLNLRANPMTQILNIGGGSGGFLHAGCHFLGNSRHILSIAVQCTYQLKDLLCHLGAIICLLANSAQYLTERLLHSVKSLTHSTNFIMSIHKLWYYISGQITISHCI